MTNNTKLGFPICNQKLLHMTVIDRKYSQSCIMCGSHHINLLHKMRKRYTTQHQCSWH